MIKRLRVYIKTLKVIFKILFTRNPYFIIVGDNKGDAYYIASLGSELTVRTWISWVSNKTVELYKKAFPNYVDKYYLKYYGDKRNKN